MDYYRVKLKDGSEIMRSNLPLREKIICNRRDKEFLKLRKDIRLKWFVLEDMILNPQQMLDDLTSKYWINRGIRLELRDFDQSNYAYDLK
jgi:hypothetical protein